MHNLMRHAWLSLLMVLVAVSSAFAQNDIGRDANTDINGMFQKIGGVRVTDGRQTVQPYSGNGYPLMENAFPPGGYTVIAPHFLSTMLCDCAGGLRQDSTSAILIPPGITRLFLRGNVRIGGLGFGSANTQDSAYAVVFAFRYLISGSNATDTLSAASWAKPSRTANDTIGSLGSPANRLAAYPAEAWDSHRQIVVYNNGTNGAAAATNSPGIQITRPVMIEISIGADEIHAGYFGLCITHLGSYLDSATAPSLRAAAAGWPIWFDMDLVGVR